MGKQLITQRRGRGFGRYRSPRHLRFTAAKHPKMRDDVQGTILGFKHEAGRIAPVAKVAYGKDEHWMIAPDGTSVGQTVRFGRHGDIVAGNTVPLGDMPEGTVVFNVELQPGDGGKLVRTAC